MVSGADELPPRLFGTDEDVRRIAAALCDCTLPRCEWTHEAHLTAVSVILLSDQAAGLERQLPQIIARYNIAVGGVNDDTQGYHETLTQYWIASARAFHATSSGALVQRVNQYVSSPEGRRDAPLRHYSRTCLFSVEARRTAVEPDVMRFAWNTLIVEACCK